MPDSQEELQGNVLGGDGGRGVLCHRGDDLRAQQNFVQEIRELRGKSLCQWTFRTSEQSPVCAGRGDVTLSNKHVTRSARLQRSWAAGPVAETKGLEKGWFQWFVKKSIYI